MDTGPNRFDVQGEEDMDQLSEINIASSVVQSMEYSKLNKEAESEETPMDTRLSSTPIVQDGGNRFTSNRDLRVNG
jgi:hypothetical protein